MEILQAILLSIVEGVSEFLPISSTGHLILTSKLLGITETDFVKSFEIFIQLGAVLAVVMLFFNKYRQNLSVWKNILAAFIPTAIIGFILYKLIKSYLLGNSLIVVLALIIGGVLLIILEKIYIPKKDQINQIEKLTIKQSLLIGLAQSVSIIPGVSRSAATILGGMFLGLNRATAVEFSFLLAVPTMLAATGLDLVKSNFSFSSAEWIIMIIGFISSFITALIVVKWFLKFIQKHTFISFGVYRIVLGALFWLIILR